MRQNNPRIGGVLTNPSDLPASTVRRESRPQDGDLVVMRESGSDCPFLIRQLPGGAQFRSATRNAALELARGFAQSHGVDVWYTDQAACNALERYRSLVTGH